MRPQTRNDEPGAWHHVMNRGIAKRTIFQQKADVRLFCALLARRVREGLIEVHSYTLLTNHFHLLLRSLKGQLSRAMLRIENPYVRAFNRKYRRDGPLLRGRFASKRILSDLHWKTVIRYIDQNAPEARIPCSNQIYPYCSAYHFLKSAGPPWLARHTIENMVQQESKKNYYNPEDYLSCFGQELTKWHKEFINTRFQEKNHNTDPLCSLIMHNPEKVREWMGLKSRVSDGANLNLAIVSPQTLARQIKRHVNQKGPKNNTHLLTWPSLRSGLFRTVCGLSLKEIAKRTNCVPSTASARIEKHHHLMRINKEYAKMAALLVSKALVADWNIPQNTPEPILPGAIIPIA